MAANLSTASRTASSVLLCDVERTHQPMTIVMRLVIHPFGVKRVERTESSKVSHPNSTGTDVSMAPYKDDVRFVVASPYRTTVLQRLMSGPATPSMIADDTHIERAWTGSGHRGSLVRMGVAPVTDSDRFALAVTAGRSVTTVGTPPLIACCSRSRFCNKQVMTSGTGHPRARSVPDVGVIEASQRA